MSIVGTKTARVQQEKAGPSRGLLPGNEDPLFMEHVKGLRAKLEYHIDGFNRKVVAVTSSISGEGKTMLSAHLALNFVASARRKVLLVDVDMRKGDLARELGVPPTPGLSELLCGTATYDAVVRNSFAPWMYAVTAGSKVGSPPDLLARTVFHDFLNESRKRFDLILLDTPPVIPVADTLAIRELVDGFLFIYRAGLTPYPLLRQSVEEIGEKKIIGIVMNGVAQQKKSYYSKYYGKYYTKPAV